MKKLHGRKKEKRKQYCRVPIPALVGAGLLNGGLLALGGFVLTENPVISAGFALAFVPVALWGFVRDYREKNGKNVEKQFLEAMQAVLSSVSAGTSVEQAFAELYEDYRNGSGLPIGLIAEDIGRISRLAKMKYSFYELLFDFAERTGSGEILSCVQAMRIVAGKGGSMVSILRSTLSNLRIKAETDEEIRQTLALPRYNQKIITVMPFLLVLMIKSISRDYIGVLYTTAAGRIVVAAVSGVMLLGWGISRALCRIEV